MSVNEMAVDYLQQAITLMQNEDYQGALSYAEKAQTVDKRYFTGNEQRAYYIQGELSKKCFRPL